MSSHCNFAAITPNADGTYRVLIVRGRAGMGNALDVVFQIIGEQLSLSQAAGVATAAPHVRQLDFYDYAPARNP